MGEVDYDFIETVLRQRKLPSVVESFHPDSRNTHDSTRADSAVHAVQYSICK